MDNEGWESHQIANSVRQVNIWVGFFLTKIQDWILKSKNRLRNWWMHSGQGFFGSLDALWSQWSRNLFSDLIIQSWIFPKKYTLCFVMWKIWLQVHFVDVYNLSSKLIDPQLALVIFLVDIKMVAWEGSHVG